LGVVYTSEGQWEKAANVMLRGWKRADEIEDEHVRFRFLMKLCETSFRIGKPLQAFAVLKSIDPPASKEDMPAFQVMSVQVFCAVGDVQKALSTFRKAIENQDYRNALTMLALVADDLRAARAFHAVRDAVKAKCTREDGELGIIEHYVSVKDEQEQKSNILRMLVTPNKLIGLGVIVAVIFFVYLLYLVEQWSLRNWKMQPLS